MASVILGSVRDLWKKVADAATGAGTAKPTNVLQVGGSDGTNLQAVSVDSAGRQNVVNRNSSGTEIFTAANPGAMALYGSKPAFTYDLLTIKFLLLVRGATMYRRNGTKLEKSTDYGSSWSVVKDFAPELPWFAWKPLDTNNNVLLVWVGATSSGPFSLHRSTDEVTFAQVATNVYAPYQVNGVGYYQASAASQIVFGEYVDSGISHSLYRSIDNGATWTAVVTHTSSQSRHWHSVTWGRQVGGWVATTGDLESETHWLFSEDGATWYEVLNPNSVESRHPYRTTHVEVMGKDTLLWGADASALTSNFPGIYRATIGGIQRPELVLPMNDIIQGLHRQGPIIIVPTTIGAGNSQRFAQIYVSLDGGNTWHMDARYAGVGGTPLIGKMYGEDDTGRVYLECNNIGASANVLRMTKPEGVRF